MTFWSVLLVFQTMQPFLWCSTEWCDRLRCELAGDSPWNKEASHFISEDLFKKIKIMQKTWVKNRVKHPTCLDKQPTHKLLHGEIWEFRPLLNTGLHPLPLKNCTTLNWTSFLLYKDRIYFLYFYQINFTFLEKSMFYIISLSQTPLPPGALHNN